MNRPLALKKIWQIDQCHLGLLWTDGIQQSLRLSDVQKHCPCAGCVDEITGLRKEGDLRIDKNVEAIVIRNVGRYALSIQFTSGCSTGIYHFQQLRDINKEETNECS